MVLPKTFSGFYIYGSSIYGTNTDGSDVDMATINCNYYVSEGVDQTNYTLDEFQSELDSYLPTAWEGYSLQFHGNRYEDKYSFTHIIKLDVDKQKLRDSFSRVASNSFVKAKKKLLVQDTYNRSASMKSLFHSIRILDFGTQIANHGYVVNFESCNHIWDMIVNDYKLNDTEVLKLIVDKYQPLRNSYASAFRLTSPKVAT